MANEDSYAEAHRRSESTWEKLKADPQSFTMLSGDRPTGHLHLGHFFGTIRERIRMQDMGVHTNILIADYQVITDRDNTEHIRQYTYDMVLDYLALGVNPEKTMIFTHSAVPALNQLMLPFLSLVTESELLRNPTVKAEQEASGHALTGLLLTYPVHQACDILFCKANVVPVGRDQLPHIEQTRNIARRFNERYGQVFPMPVGLLSETPLLPGLDGRKMSKSYGNGIFLRDVMADIEPKVKGMFTDPARLRKSDPGNPDVCNLFPYHVLLADKATQEEVRAGCTGATMGCVQCKKIFLNNLEEFLAPLHERRAQFAANPGLIDEILAVGREKASASANATMALVREAMHL